MPNPANIVTFNDFMTAETETGNPEPSSRNPLRQLAAEQLLRARLVPASRSNQLTDATEVVRFLSNAVIDAHRGILNDGSANLKDRRLSYQAVCNHFMILLAMAGGIEPPQE